MSICYDSIVMQFITLSKKEYRELRQLRAKLDQLLGTVSLREKPIMTGDDLLRFAKMKIKGGPKDLSLKADSYLYER